MQTPTELEVTYFTPSPVVVTVALKPAPPYVPLKGRLAIVGVLGVPLPTLALLSVPKEPL